MTAAFTIPASAQELMNRSKLITGLDISDVSIEEPLARLLRSLNTEAELSRAGCVAMEQRLLRILCNRLRMLRDFALHPEINDQQIVRPLFLTGAGRTGSTKAQKLLATTGDFIYLPFWHGYSLALRTGRPDEDPAERIKEASEYINWFDTQAPHSRVTHAFGVLEPEEETTIMEHENFGLWVSQFVHVPSFTTWCTSSGFRSAFQFLKQGLKYLQWQFHAGDRRPWVLKCPVYFGVEPLLAEAFPDALFVATHRDPCSTLPSAASTMENFLKAYSDVDRRESVARMVLIALTQGARAFMAWRQSPGALPILDVSYTDLIDDSEGVVERIYAHIGRGFTDATRRAVRAWEADNTQHKPGVHRYTGERYALEPAVIRQSLGNYIERYMRHF